MNVLKNAVEAQDYPGREKEWSRKINKRNRAVIYLLQKYVLEHQIMRKLLVWLLSA